MIDVLLIEADQAIADQVLLAVKNTGLKVKHCRNRFEAMGEIWVMAKLRKMPKFIIMSLWLVDPKSDTFKACESVSSLEEVATSLPILKNLSKLQFNSKVLVLSDNVAEARLVIKKAEFDLNIEVKIRAENFVQQTVCNAIRGVVSDMRTRFTQLTEDQVNELASASA